MAENKKILLLGDGAVGKTSLVHRFVEGQFKERYKATIGVDIFSKPAEGVDLQIWDLSGQEHFAAVRSKFYSKAEGALLVFDLTNRKTFERLDNWIKESEAGVGNSIPMVILGNKSDLTELISISDAEINDYATGKNWKWLKSSAKSGDNVEVAFATIAKLVSK
jgi:small GTP-binding protein